jgi:hypothetical protein
MACRVHHSHQVFNMGEWNSPSFTRGYGGGRLVPDHGNRHYVVRGGWERGGRGRGFGRSPTSASFPPEADMKKGLDASKVIETIPTPPRPISLEEVPIENVQYVSSYNWVDAEQRTIVAPGTSSPPPILKDIAHSHRVPPPQRRFPSYLDRA